MPRPHRPACVLTAVLSSLVAVAWAAPADDGHDLAATLRIVGERVERYFARAQSLVCLETVRLRPFGTMAGLSARGRTVESELRLSWGAPEEPAGILEAKTERQVLKVNGHAPRKNDPNDCTTPERQSTEVPALAMLLPQQQPAHVFTYAGMGRVDRRTAIMVDFAVLADPLVTVALADGREDCLSFSIDGGTRGRVWIDPETYDVLRLDQRLSGLVEVPLPRAMALRSDRRSWTVERLDVSTRFKPVTFQDPDETLVLPVSTSSFTIARGAGTPQMWTSTDYTQYQRFLTGGRLVP